MALKFLYHPVKNPINQSNLFGTPSPMYTAMGQKGHPGIDYECPLYTPIYAPCDGAAFYASDKDGGDGIWIRYPNNQKPQYSIILWHLPNPTDTAHWVIPWGNDAVTNVKAGQLIGYSGNSGYPRESSGPHLHLGVMPCDSMGGPLEPANGFQGCQDPQQFLTSLYAQDIPTLDATLQATDQVVQAVVQSPLPSSTKLSFTEKVEQFLEWLLTKIQK